MRRAEFRGSDGIVHQYLMGLQRHGGMERVDVQANVKRHLFDGANAITLKAGPYSAMVLPAQGGNLVSFEDEERQLSFLRKPESLAAIVEKPLLYGFPVLFPPNRYEDGAFTVNGHAYHFPVTETKTHNHIHGFLKDVPWSVSETGESEDAAYVELTQRVDEKHAAHRYFPHEFTIALRYTLTRAGLQQDVRVENCGTAAMPLMLGFHTALRIPFAKDSHVDDYRIKATIGDHFELSPRMLPTGRLQPLTPEEERLQTSGVQPFYAALDHHYKALPQDGRNYATLTDTRLGVRLVFEVDTQYRYWMVFNNFGRGEYICPEPQTNMVNAPNVNLSSDETGIVILKPNDVWTAVSRLYVEEA